MLFHGFLLWQGNWYLGANSKEIKSPIAEDRFYGIVRGELTPRQPNHQIELHQGVHENSSLTETLFERLSKDIAVIFAPDKHAHSWIKITLDILDQSVDRIPTGALGQ
jgi:hypothetical protein